MRLALVTLLLTGCSQDNGTAPPPSNLTVNSIMPVEPETWAQTGTLTCRFQVRQSCGADGCERAQPTVFVRWTPRTSTYERCDERGCDSYQAQVSYSGIFANIVLPQNAAMARLSEDGVMMEITTMHMGAMVQHGRCS